MNDRLQRLLKQAGLDSPVASREPMSGGIGNTMTVVTLEDGARVVLREYTWGTHGWPVEDVVSPPTPTWGHMVAAQIERCVERVPQAGEHRAAIADLALRLPAALEPDPPVLIHNDATPVNVMVDEERVTGWCD